VSAVFWVSYAVLWVLVVVLVVAVFALYQHFGQMYLSSADGRGEQGPRLDEPLRAAEAEDLTGAPLLLPPDRRPVLVLFTSTSCELCAKLRAAVAEYVTAPDALDVVVLCDGTARMVREWAAALPRPVRVVADVRGRQAIRYGVGVLPFLAATDAEGIVRYRGVVNDLDGLRAAAAEAAAVRLPVVAPEHTHPAGSVEKELTP
jgi:hypothetical protein